MQQAVRCPYCDELSRVPASAVGQYVSCPNCSRPFSAVAEELPEDPKPSRRNVPVVYPVKKSVPVVHPAPGWDEYEIPADPEPPHGPRSVLFGLALLPFVIPLLWILGPLITGKDAIFTFALPMAIAASATGLCLGVVLAADWSFATRVKSILILVFVMHFLAAFLYFLKPEWVEAFRKQIGKGNERTWQKFTPPERMYSVQVPDEMHEDDQQIVKGWSLKGYRTADKDGPATYFVAFGNQPKELNGEQDEPFFKEAQAKAMDALNATLTGQPRPVRLTGCPGREYVFTLPDRNTKRIVRIFRKEQFVFVAAVEDAFLTPGANDVRYFFDHIDLKKQ
ncbi:ABC transporter permease [Limnoglobus roseus]|uniref:Uncharacterized protein n=1 Tax=Limnoglobus roseus TaxID=2598579 RepID=A0A5C1AR84_9BACT|nr:ABC transporter permease [Limnoglobus roseus]QEL20252.1 hypothetical protein PX52LOC_07344 [Limnoglobus roseus]